MTKGQTALGNRVRERREELGLTLAELRDQLVNVGLARGTSQQHLSQIERGQTWPSFELVSALDQVLRTNGELHYLLRDAKVPRDRGVAGDLVIAAHLFFPLYLTGTPPVAIPHEPTRYDFVPRLGCTPVGDDSVAVYTFPFNVALIHELHVATFEDLADLATWRDQQIARCPSAAAERLVEVGYDVAPRDHEPYCFTSFVVHDLPWTDSRDRRRALEILSVPAVLLTPAGELGGRDRAEHLLRSNESLGDLVDFSFAGSHIGFASWSAVALHPDAPDNEIVDALIEFEIQLQAFWCYASNVEHSANCCAEEFDDYFLGRVLRKLQRPWPTEHTTVRRLREALVTTSRITELVDSARESIDAQKGSRR